MGSISLITPMHSPLGTVAHMCHDVVPATLPSVGERASSEWPFGSPWGVLTHAPVNSFSFP